MRPRRVRRAALARLVVFLWFLVAATGPVSAAGVTSLLLDSEPGEPIGDGQFYFFTPDDGEFRSGFDSPDHYEPHPNGYVSLRFSGIAGGRGSWSLQFAAPPGDPLGVTAYEDAVPIFRQGPGQPGLQVSGPGRLCGGTFGRFEVNQVAFDADGVLAAFWATFEQTCAGAVLRGEIRYNAIVPVVLRAPSHVMIAERQSMSFEVEGVDALGHPVALSASGLPQGASWTDEGGGTGRLSWTPEVGQAGAYWLAFQGLSNDGHTDVVYTEIEVIFGFDDFDRAIPFSEVSFESRVFNTAATPAIDDPECLGPVEGTVWYAFTPTQDVRIYANTYPAGPFGDKTLSVYEGERGALLQLACGLNQVWFEASAGQTYYLMVGLPSGSELRFFAHAVPAPPPNDDFDHATAFETLPFSDTLDTRGATHASGDPGNCGSSLPSFGQRAGVWYAYSPVEDTRVTIDIAESDYHPKVTVFTGTRGSLNPLGCGVERFRFTAYAGQTYHLMIALGPALRRIGSVPGGQLILSMTGMPPLSIGVTIDGKVAFDPHRGTAVLGGMATCSRAARVVVSGTLRQSRLAGNFEVSVSCDGATAWQAEVTPDSTGRGRTRFAGGPAQLILHAVGVPDVDPDDVASTMGLSAVTLRGRKPSR
jgi:hypothetical protein